ncbi:MAG: GDP-mannose 4,6-dehydratase [Desulfobacterota bacterium]|nr:GDP-mannose 4,6-dehydratase [Thermodesulfobacteriota bacterium]
MGLNSKEGSIEEVSQGGFWKGKNVFITGCTGFLGFWLTKHLLQQGAHVVGLIRDEVPMAAFYRENLHQRITVVRGDVENGTLLERVVGEYAIDTVFHLAAQPIVTVAYHNPIATFKANIEGTWNVLEACRRHHPQVKRIIVASSDKAYGQQKKLPYTEDAELRGTHPYDVSKSCADLICGTYVTTYGLPVCVTRCGNFYGGGDLNFNRIVPGTIRSVLLDEPVVIRSDGTPLRDYLYIKDAVYAYCMLAENIEALGLPGEAFNFSSGTPVSVLDITRMILNAMGKPDYPVQIMKSACGEIQDQYLSIEKAQRVLGWMPRYGFELGIHETIMWYQNYFAHLRASESKE